MINQSKLLCQALMGAAFAIATIQPTLADSSNLLPNLSDPNNCGALIQQGAVNPPTPVSDSDISKVQTCLQSCSSLYSNTFDSVAGVNYCASNLNNLYFASIAKSNSDQISSNLSTGTIQAAPMTAPNTTSSSTVNSTMPPPVTEPAPLSNSTPPAAAPTTPTPDQKPTNEKKSSINWF